MHGIDLGARMILCITDILHAKAVRILKLISKNVKSVTLDG
jgi:hypothetical protein